MWESVKNKKHVRKVRYPNLPGSNPDAIISVISPVHPQSKESRKTKTTTLLLRHGHPPKDFNVNDQTLISPVPSFSGCALCRLQCALIDEKKRSCCWPTAKKLSSSSSRQRRRQWRHWRFFPFLAIDRSSSRSTVHTGHDCQLRRLAHLLPLEQLNFRSEPTQEFRRYLRSRTIRFLV